MQYSNAASPLRKSASYFDGCAYTQPSTDKSADRIQKADGGGIRIVVRPGRFFDIRRQWRERRLRRPPQYRHDSKKDSPFLQAHRCYKASYPHRRYRFPDAGYNRTRRDLQADRRWLAHNHILLRHTKRQIDPGTQKPQNKGQRRIFVLINTILQEYGGLNTIL